MHAYRLAVVLVAVTCVSAVASAPQREAVKLATAVSTADRDRDGYPDALELSGADSRAFADWFAAVAEAQFYALSPRWAPTDQDCAGLLRLAFIEALKPKDPAWFAQFRYLPPRAFPNQKALGYPWPLVLRSVFRVAPGPFTVGDVEAGRFVGRTDARSLLLYSARFISRDPRAARRGDLLFFLRPNLGEYHSMVYLGRNRVVYHTGSGPGGGEVRLVTLETLSRHPLPEFHPSLSNPSFLGVYRWNIEQ